MVHEDICLDNYAQFVLSYNVYIMLIITSLLISSEVYVQILAIVEIVSDVSIWCLVWPADWSVAPVSVFMLLSLACRKLRELSDIVSCTGCDWQRCLVDWRAVQVPTRIRNYITHLLLSLQLGEAGGSVVTVRMLDISLGQRVDQRVLKSCLHCHV